MLFAFDLQRKAILLVGGDKSQNWSGWYTANIPVADKRLDEHQAKLKKKQKEKDKKKSTKRRGRR